MTETIIVEGAEAIALTSLRLASAQCLAIDVESNGLHAYRASLCTLQIGVVDGDADVVSTVYVVDSLGVSDAELAPLRAPLGDAGPRKLVHDLAFDARLLARRGVPIGRLFDTSIAARFLGVTSTGLAALVAARVGATLSKELQHHDWARRPLGPEVLPYLAADVAHLPALARSLEADIESKGIALEVEAETAFRLAGALADLDDLDPRPPYARIKGASELDPIALAVLRRLAEVREGAAQRWDVPAFKVLGNEQLLQLARKRPSTLHDARAIPGVDRGRGASLGPELLAAIAHGAREADVPAAERDAFFARPPPPARALVEARRAREHRLSAFRRAEAKRRGVDEQVVLPGHCLQEIADRAPSTREELATIGGIAETRIDRYADEILRAVAGEAGAIDAGRTPPG